MTGMRAKTTVVGNVVVPEEAIAEGTDVGVLTTDEGGIYLDEATEQELAQAMAEADTEEGASVEEAFAAVPVTALSPTLSPSGRGRLALSVTPCARRA